MRYTNDVINKKIKDGNRRKIIFRIVIYILIIPIIIYNISLIVFSIINKNETPCFFGIKTFVIVSGSMQPDLMIGDIVIVKKCDKNDINVGDIISYRSGQSVITHRIVEFIESDGQTGYITKGDNNNVKDNVVVKFEDIEGKYIGKISKLGNVVLFLKNKIVIISIILIFYLIYVHELKVNEKIQIRKEKREKFEKR